VDELKRLKKRFATPRRTRLIEGGDHLMAAKAASQRPNAELQRQQALGAISGDARLLIQCDGQVKVISPQVLGRMHLQDTAALSDEPSPARLILPIDPPPRLLALTAEGRVALVRWEFAGQQPGPLERFLPSAMEGETVINLLPLPDADGDHAKRQLSLGLLSSDGRFKRLPLEDMQELSGRAASVLKLKDGVSLRSGVICSEGGTIALVSDIGRVLRLPVDDKALPLMGKLAQGPVAMRLLPGEHLVGAVSLPADDPGHLIAATRQGRLFRRDLSDLRLCNRGDLGDLAIDLNTTAVPEDRLVAICLAAPLLGLVSSQGRHGRIASQAISVDDSLQLPMRNGETVQALVALINGSNNSPE
jgi:DNA gyrase subunit A